MVWKYMSFNQTGDISTLNGSSLKLVDKFTYLGSSVSSTETDIDTRLAKAWTASNRLSVIWKSDLTDKMNAVSSKQRSCRYCYMDARVKAGRPARTYIQQLCADTGCSSEDLPEAMDDRKGWWEWVRDIRADSATWWWWWSMKNSLKHLICRVDVCIAISEN